MSPILMVRVVVAMLVVPTLCAVSYAQPSPKVHLMVADCVGRSSSGRLNAGDLVTSGISAELRNMANPGSERYNIVDRSGIGEAQLPVQPDRPDSASTAGSAPPKGAVRLALALNVDMLVESTLDIRSSKRGRSEVDLRIRFWDMELRDYVIGWSARRSGQTVTKAVEAAVRTAVQRCLECTVVHCSVLAVDGQHVTVNAGLANRIGVGSTLLVVRRKEGERTTTVARLQVLNAISRYAEAIFSGGSPRIGDE